MMKFLIPTAKEIKEDNKPYPQHLSQKSQILVNHMNALSIEELEKSYKVSPQIAQTELLKWQDIKNGEALAYPALYLFNGLMYRHIKRQHLTVEEKAFLKEKVFITSALYGIIPALKPIVPHRLDFNTKVKIKGESLKNYWRKTYDNFALDNPSIVSLLSSEFEAVFSPKLRNQLITLRFLENQNGQLKSHSTISKKARGAFLTQVIQQQTKTVDELKIISFNGFSYQDNLSEPLKLIFIKQSK